MFQIVYVVLALSWFALSFRVVEENQVRVLKFRNCPNTDLPLKYNMTIQQTGKGSIALNGYITVSKDLGRITLLNVKLNKCRSYSASETCEYFATCNYKNPCTLMGARNQVWSTFIDSIHPPFLCPLTKNTFVLQNASFDSSFISKVKGMNGMYWDIKAKLFVDKKCVSCYEIGLDFRKIRRKIQ